MMHRDGVPGPRHVPTQNVFFLLLRLKELWEHRIGIWEPSEGLFLPDRHDAAYSYLLLIEWIERGPVISPSYMALH